jgi:glutamine amidotransferase
MGRHIAVVDYGVGNLRNVYKALEAAGAPARIVTEPGELAGAAGIVLPGVGAFGDAAANLRRAGFEALLLDAIAAGIPLLGICVGMQLLFDESEEHGRHPGLGLLPGRVRRFEGERPVPHMGWNRLRALRPHPILDGVADGAHVYFVHSYYCDAPGEVVIASSDYGHDFAAIVGRGSVLGVQFHPEKSQEVGLRMVESFVRVVDTARRACPREMGCHTEGAA